jgi:hypothetical protein
MPAPLVRLMSQAHITALIVATQFVAGPTLGAPGVPVRSTVRRARDRGQATTEYALIMLAAALVALLVVAWATAGGGAGKIGRLFDRVVDSVLDRV